MLPSLRKRSIFYLFLYIYYQAQGIVNICWEWSEVWSSLKEWECARQEKSWANTEKESSHQASMGLKVTLCWEQHSGLFLAITYPSFLDTSLSAAAPVFSCRLHKTPLGVISFFCYPLLNPVYSGFSSTIAREWLLLRSLVTSLLLNPVDISQLSS